MDCPKCKRAAPEDAVFCPYCGRKLVPERRKRKRPNGMGTVWKKSGNRSKPWEAQKNGIYIGSYSTKYDAEQALRALDDVKVSENLNLTFSQIYDKWYPEHSRTVTAKGMEGYATAYKHCSELYGAVFRRLRTADFQNVIVRMEGNSMSRSSCEKVLQLFGQLSEWAIREEICHTNYARFVTVNAKQKSSKTPFTTEQIAAIRASSDPAARIAVILLATGCRPNELFSVRMDQCFEDYFISGSKTDAGRNRVIPVASFGLDAYHALRSAALDAHCPRLIDAYQGNHAYPNYAKRDWKTLMESLGIEGMTPYHCRHTYTTLAVQSGVKPEILQRIMGHADYSTTANIYTHPDTPDILRESAKVTLPE